MVEPSVSVVIPTLNVSEMLPRCLESIKSQEYSGEVRVLVIDGGSSDSTVEIAREYDAEVLVRPGIYSTGITGARNLGLALCASDYYWQLDADNFLVERSVLRCLVQPFAVEEQLSVSFPMVVPHPTCPSISNWYALEESEKIGEIARAGQHKKGWVLFEDLAFGLTNASLVKTDVLRQVGGYDSDVRTLARMRRAGRSRGALILDGHYIHLTARHPQEVLDKFRRRLRRFGGMSNAELRTYFAAYEPDRRDLQLSTSLGVLGSPLRAMAHLLKGHDRAWGWGLVFPALVALAAVRDPSCALRTFFRFL